MKKFKKIVVLEPIRFDIESEEKLKEYADEVVIYRDIPPNAEEIILRVGDADALLVFYTSQITSEIICSCPNLKYIGMCCSLYTPESANVDIPYANTRGITVKGIRRYGDRGVAEFVASEIISLLHGFHGVRFKDEELELAGMKVGVVGVGDVGSIVVDVLLALKMDVYYNCRTRKPKLEEKGAKYLPLNDMLMQVDILSTHLHKHTQIMTADDFKTFGNGKILINTTFTPPYPLDALREWLNHEGNFYILDSATSIGGAESEIFSLPNVICPDVVAGQSTRSGVLLREKVLENIREYLDED